MNQADFLNDPIKWVKLCWPEINIYDKQEEILYSIRDNDETVVPAGNALGKDFIAGLAALWFFCSRTPARVITTSVDQPQLKGVLWGEIRNFIRTSRYPLPIEVNDLLIRQVIGGEQVPKSYLIGRVAAKGEGLLGHHLARTENGLPRTLCIFDEASGIDQVSYDVTDTWAHRKLIIGNCYECRNRFRDAVKAGDIRDPDNPDRYYTKVIQIRGIDSPSVKLNLARVAKGLEPTNEIIIPGVLPYSDYMKRRNTWDEIRQAIGLDAEFYEGAELLLFPPTWLNGSEVAARSITGQRIPKALGVDPAEGGDDTSWTAIDELGIIKKITQKTPDTDIIPGITIGLIKELGLAANQVWFDRGGGGKQHADRMRKLGHNVRTVGFGEAATDPHKVRRMKTIKEREEESETRYTYKNRRAEMYGLLSMLLDPSDNERVFGIDSQYSELRRQLAPIPKLYDGEGRLYLPPKDKKNKNSTEVTLKELLGCSPDEADSLVLAVYGMLHKKMAITAGAI